VAPNRGYVAIQKRVRERYRRQVRARPVDECTPLRCRHPPESQEAGRLAFDCLLTLRSVERSVSEEVPILLPWVCAVVPVVAFAASILVRVRMRPSDAARARVREAGTSRGT
jgi:hypothetical protein